MRVIRSFKVTLDLVMEVDFYQQEYAINEVCRILKSTAEEINIGRLNNKVTEALIDATGVCSEREEVKGERKS